MTRARGAQILLIVSIILSCITGITIYNGFKEKFEAQRWVNHTNEVIDQTVNLLATLKGTETTSRGYLITKDTSFLRDYQLSVRDMRVALASIRTLTLDNSDQTNLIDNKIKPVIEARIDEINHTILLSQQHSSAQASESIMEFVKGISKLDALQENITLLIRREQQLLRSRSQRLMTISAFTEQLIYLALALIALISFIAYITIRRVNGHNAKLFLAIQELNSSLEQRVQQQTAQLTRAYQETQSQNIELAALNEELQASQEEIRSSLDQVTAINRKLEENEQLYRLVSENSQDVIALHKTDGTYTYISPSAKALLGYDPAELIGTSGFDLILPDDAKHINETAKQLALAGETLLNTQFRLKRKDGTYIWVEAYTKPIVNDEGRVVSIQTSIRDISERKVAEEALILAKDQAEAATKAKSQFLSTMSHEIRTPMNAVIGLTHILLQNQPRQDQIDNLKLLKFSGENLLTIINDILDFSKIEADKLSLEHINFKLDELISTIITIHASRARDKGIRLDTDFDSNTPAIVKGDPVRINQVITNLLSNAIKFTTRGFVKMIVRSEATSDDRHLISFTVQDTGIGIPPEKISSIFESFSQANSDTTRKFGGTGLGLTISKRLVQMMGGTLTLDSVVNRGSTFTFSLVMEEGHMLTELDLVHDRVFNAAKEKRKILLVEDNHVNQVVATSFLQSWNIDVDCADNGNIALEKIKSKEYQLVLMDLEMPEMDGYSTTQAIRRMDDKYFHDLPILALTASAMSEVRKQALDSGMNDLLTKPFNPNDLYDKINALIHLNHSGATGHRGKNWSDNLDLYADGNAEFKRELTGLVIENLKELQRAVDHLKHDDGFTIYKRAAHKVKTSLKMVAHDQLNDLVSELNALIKVGAPLDQLDGIVREFATLSDALIKELESAL